LIHGWPECRRAAGRGWRRAPPPSSRSPVPARIADDRPSTSSLRIGRWIRVTDGRAAVGGAAAPSCRGER
jgi:hypothetical protein